MKEKKIDTYYDVLKQYADSEMYPLHMPGHKRRGFAAVLEELEAFLTSDSCGDLQDNNIWECVPEKPSKESILKSFQDKKFAWKEPKLLDEVMSLDVTEVSDLDDLHHACGALKASMDEMAKLYGATKSYYLVNGSTSGNLVALEAVTAFGDEVLIARNCHKSVYNEIIHRGLRPYYVYPQYVDDLGINGSISPQDIEKVLQAHPTIKAVMIVSPTYDGVISNISEIAQVVHAHQIPLIVDEAHGAHMFEETIHLGADLVVQSLHKTLPSLTQTAVLHVRDEYVSLKQVEQALQYFQSSSPSYLLVASGDACIQFCKIFRQELLGLFEEKLHFLYESCKKLQEIRIYPYQFPENYGIFKRDASKVLIASRHGVMGGEEIGAFLHDNGYLELEMTALGYGLALLTPFDSWEGLQRLVACLEQLDAVAYQDYVEQESIESRKQGTFMDESFGEGDFAEYGYRPVYPRCQCTPYEASRRKTKEVFWDEALGYVAADLVYVYPPGIPLLVPGETIDEKVLNQGKSYRARGFVLRGLSEKGTLSVLQL